MPVIEVIKIQNNLHTPRRDIARCLVVDITILHKNFQDHTTPSQKRDIARCLIKIKHVLLVIEVLKI